MTIKQGDFIEIDYTGRLADGEKECFDTTIEEVAKKEGIHSPKTKYGSTIVVIGEKHLIAGLDRQLVGKDVGKHTFHVEDIEAFGKKSAKLLKLIPGKVFARDQIRPFPGMQVNVDDQIGIVRTVSGGRVIVDFNHPLSSKDVEYDVDVKRIVTDKKEQLDSIFAMMGMPIDKTEVKDNNAIIYTKTFLPEQLTAPLANDIKRMVGVNGVSFETTAKKEDKPTIKTETPKPVEEKKE